MQIIFSSFFFCESLIDVKNYFICIGWEAKEKTLVNSHFFRSFS